MKKLKEERCDILKSLLWLTFLLPLIIFLIGNGIAYAGKGKVTICHYPPGNPENPQTIIVSESAVPAHLQHGDLLGECGVLLEGPPEAPAMSALRHVSLISGIPLNERGIDDSEREVALTELLLKFTPNATVGEVNEVLVRFGIRIKWMIEDVPYLLVRLPHQGTVGGLDALVTQLEATSIFEQVLRSYFPAPSVLPQNFDPATLNQFDVIDHLLGVHAPAAWNALTTLHGAQAPTLLIADWFGAGEPLVPPFAIATSPGDYSSTTYNIGLSSGHGYHVLGIAAADFGGELATGLFPSLPGSPLVVSAVDLSIGLSWPAIYGALIDKLVNLTPSQRVIVNTSLGFKCNSIRNVVNCGWTNARLEAMTWVTMVKAKNLEDKFLHVTAAGNMEVPGDDDARTASPFTAAALLLLSFLEPNLTNTIVVENIVGRVNPPYAPQCLNASSKIGGHVSAVGTEVDSYLQPSIVRMSWTGTSMATPQVAALAAYVWALNPTLSPAQLKQMIINRAREVTLPANLPANCTATQPKPVISAYSTVLAVDQPVALTAAGTPADAPVRSAILDVADSSGVEGSDGKFDQGDLKVLMDKIPQGVAPAQPRCTGYDWSRYDLSGEGHTGADWGSRFNLDINKPPTWTYVTAPEDSNMCFNETCVTDLQVMCYYAYSPVYTGSNMERDNLLHGFCGQGQKTWIQSPLLPFNDLLAGPYTGKAMIAADGRGNVFAAAEYRDEGRLAGIAISKVFSGGATLITKLSGEISLSGFFVDKAGNIFLMNQDTLGNLIVNRYSAEYGWETAHILDNVALTPVISVDIAADDCGNAIITWVVITQVSTNDGFHFYFTVKAAPYDVNSGWEITTVLAVEDSEYISAPYHPPAIWQVGIPISKVAVNSKGDALVVWSGFEVSDQTRAIRAREYKVDSGWGATKRIAAPNMLTDRLLNIVMDPLGNAIVTSYSWRSGTRATHYNINSGWQPSFNVASNALDFSAISTGTPEWGLYKIAMDECGNAMLVYTELTAGALENGQFSLMSKRYSVDEGWEADATVVDAVFGYTTSTTDPSTDPPGVYITYHGNRMSYFAMHGGGNGTLIMLDPSDDFPVNWYAHARQYRAGKGWDDTVSTFFAGSYVQDEFSIFDKYGNATALWYICDPSPTGPKGVFVTRFE